MARLTFRQGILKHQVDTLNQQSFLQVSGGYVNLVVSPDPVIITIAHKDTDYLFTEFKTMNQAWGPFSAGQHYWLYWDINKATGERTFGSTTFEPVKSPYPPHGLGSPGAPILGQHWFNTITNEMFEYNGLNWAPVIRVFACKLDSTLTPRSVSDRSPEFIGTQVGLNANIRAGGLVFDNSGNPVKKDDHTFFTTEDQFITGVPTGASLRINNIIVRAIAQNNFAAHQVVEFSDFNKIIHASPFSQHTKIYGITDEDIVTLDEANFVLEGMIYDEMWDWVALGAEVNDPVYISDTGEIQLDPAIPNQLPVGVVIDRQEILFAPDKFGGGSGGSSVGTFLDLTDTPSSYTGMGTYILRVNATEDGVEFVPDTGLAGTVDWGEIQGLLSDQTDLQAALDALQTQIATNASNLTDLNNVFINHTHTKSQISDFVEGDYATAAQGALADTALQPGDAIAAGDNISTLFNDIGYITTETDPVFLSQKGAVNGVASLDATGKVYPSQLPATAVTDVFVVNNEISRLALPATTGDVAVQLDTSRSYILQGTDPTNATHWVELLSPGGTGNVDSVNGQTGIVVLNYTDVGAASAIHSHYLGDLTNVNATVPSQNHTIKWNGIDQWVPGFIAASEITGLSTAIQTELGSLTLNDISDVNAPFPSIGDVLTWTGGTWEASAGGSSGASALADLTDVDLTTVAQQDGDALIWDSVNSKWVPTGDFITVADMSGYLQTGDNISGLTNDAGYLTAGTLPAIAITSVTVVADIAARDALTVQEGDVAKVTADNTSYIYDDTTGWVQLNDVNLTSADISDFTTEVNNLITSSNIENLNNVSGTPSDGDVLIYNSTTGDWEPSPLPTVSVPYDLAGFIPGLSSASIEVFSYISTKTTHRLLSSTNGTPVARAKVGATAQTVLNINKINISGTQSVVGTITFAAGGGAWATGTVTITSNVDLISNEMITITGPGVEDVTLEDITFSFDGLIV